MDEEAKTIEGNDEAALDAELAESIASVQAGKVLDTSVKPSEESASTSEETTSGETGSTGEATGDSQATGKDGEVEFRIPNKGKFETDAAYEKRIELFDLVKRRKAATTPEAKAALSVEISKAKGDLKTLGGTERFTQQKVESTDSGEVDPNLAADQERLRQLGGATKEDVAEMVRQTAFEQEVQSGIKNFVDSDKHPELKDIDIREVFFDFVDNNYVWQGKSGKDLEAVLGMAYENMFRPSETMTERVLKGADVAVKVNAMQFPGGTGEKKTYAPEIQKSIDELKATGMSEEKALELLSE